MMYNKRNKAITTDHRLLASHHVRLHRSTHSIEETAQHFSIKEAYVPFAADLRIRMDNGQPLCPAWAITSILKRAGELR